MNWRWTIQIAVQRNDHFLLCSVYRDRWRLLCWPPVSHITCPLRGLRWWCSSTPLTTLWRQMQPEVGHQLQIIQSRHNSTTADRQDHTGSLEPPWSTRPQGSRSLPHQDLLPPVPNKTGERWPSCGRRVRHWRSSLPRVVWPLVPEGRQDRALTSPPWEILPRSSTNANSFHRVKEHWSPAVCVMLWTRQFGFQDFSIAYHHFV